MNQKSYVIQSLELHLFFARIMKEHSLFLEAAFTPANATSAKKAEWFKEQFEGLLSDVVKLSGGRVRQSTLDSGEIVTDFTLNAEKQTSRFTGIEINTSITESELRLRGINGADFRMPGRINLINRRALQLTSGLIEFKEQILRDVKSCRMFTMNYPLLIEHILREARLYRSYIAAIENGTMTNRFMRDSEQFWNRIMMEHAMFIRGLLDPSEEELIKAADGFAEEYAALLVQARERSDASSFDIASASLKETLSFRDFKKAGVEGIEKCEIASVILPLLADHVLREANHYIRLLKS